MRYDSQSHLRSRRSVTETILETLTQSAARPSLSRPAAGRRHRLRRLGGGLATVAALAALGLAFVPPAADLPAVAASGEPIAYLELARGSVHAGTPSRLLTLSAGEPVHAGTVIDTGPPQAGPRAAGVVAAKADEVTEAGRAEAGRAEAGRAEAGRAAFRLAGGQSVRLDLDSRVRFASSTSMVLERGAVYVDSAGGASVEVRTTLGVVRDVGTQFEVRLLAGSEAGDALRVRVREGSVLLERGQLSHHAAVGEQLLVDAGGVVERGAAAVHGPHWDWVLDTAPAPDVAGRPLQAFLDWASHEGGWKLRFADRETARVASTTLLHGDLHGLTLAEASTVVLDGSGLGYRLDRGHLVVGPAGGDER